MRTRVSVYVLAIQNGRILLTQLAERCMRGGSWTLPGGGIDHGEQPIEALHREVREETSLEARNPVLYTALSYSETSEKRGDFMAVQIIYTANVDGEPTVIEVGGSTADVRWFDLADVADLPTVPFLDTVLASL